MSKGRQHQKKQEETSTNKKTNRKTTLKTKAWTTRTLIKTESDIRCFERVSMSCFVYDTRRVVHKQVKVGGMTNPVVKNEEWLQKHIYGHLRNRYSVMVNQFVMAAIKFTE